MINPDSRPAFSFAGNEAIHLLEEEPLRDKVSYRQFVQEAWGNVACPIKDDLVSTPADIIEMLTTPVIKELAEYSPYVRPSTSLNLTRPSRIHRPWFLMRCHGMELGSLYPGTEIEADVLEFIADVDLKLTQPVKEIAQQFCPVFAERFFPHWHLEPIKAPHDGYRWQTPAWFYSSSIIRDRLTRSQIPFEKRYRPWELRPLIIDVTQGKVREVIDFFNISFSYPLDKTLSRLSTLYGLFVSQMPRTGGEVAKDRRSGPMVSAWGNAMGRLLIDGREPYFDLTACLKVLQELNTCGPEYDEKEPVFAIEEAVRTIQYAIEQWDLPSKERVFGGFIDRNQPPIKKDSLDRYKKVMEKIDLDKDQITETGVKAIRQRVKHIIGLNPYLAINLLRKMGVLHHFPHLSHISDEQWEEIEANLPVCTEEIAGLPEHRYWLAFHSPERRYSGWQVYYPRDFISGWEVVAEALRKMGNLKEDIKNLPTLQLLTKVFDLQEI